MATLRTRCAIAEARRRGIRDDLLRELTIAALSACEGSSALTLDRFLEASGPLCDLSAEYMEILASGGLAKPLGGGAYELGAEQKVELAAMAISLGASPERACRLLSWAEFESVVEMALGANGYATARHYVVKGAGRSRCEIDVLGATESVVVAADCKRWKRGWVRSELRRAAEAQARRASMLAGSRALSELSKKLGIAFSSPVYIVPAVVTLLESPVKVHSGVPVVPVFKLGSFLYELPGLLDSFAIKAEAPRLS